MPMLASWMASCCGIGGLLLDDLFHGEVGIVADHAAVTGGVVHVGAEQRSRGVARSLLVTSSRSVCARSRGESP